MPLPPVIAAVELAHRVDWDDDLERDWRSQMDDEDFEGLDPHEAFEQWKAGWRARATRIIAERLEERRDEDEDE